MRWRPGSAVLLLTGALLAGSVWVARAADPDALWKIVHDRCVPDEIAHTDPAPCESVSLAEGYAILKDIRGATQFLLIPTTRVPGIESPAILATDAPNYFRLAWQARGMVSARAGHHLPDDAISLAINSVFGRTQNQLHIHIDCLRADVRDALSVHANNIGPKWALLDTPFLGRRYRAMRLAGDDLTANPFELLAHSLNDVAAEMPKHTLVVTAAPDGGFIILDDAADVSAGNVGSGEVLQDHDCAVARAS